LFSSCPVTEAGLNSCHRLMFPLFFFLPGLAVLTVLPPQQSLVSPPKKAPIPQNPSGHSPPNPQVVTISFCICSVMSYKRNPISHVVLHFPIYINAFTQSTRQRFPVYCITFKRIRYRNKLKHALYILF